MRGDNEVIVIGMNHVNTLGVIRALGKAGIRSNIIIQSQHPYIYVKKSKYIKKCFITQNNDDEILDVLKQFMSNKTNKSIIIPTSDFAVSFIDRNYSILKNHFLTQNSNNKTNNIIDNMDKYKQQKMCNEFGLSTIFSKIIDLNIDINIDEFNIPFPCIIKPNSSFEGKKSDITICYNKNEVITILQELKQKEYTKVLIQELIEYDSEIDIIGFSSNGNTYFSAIIEKFRISPPKRGSTSFGKVILIDEYKDVLEKLQKYFTAIKYEGIFDIDVFKTTNGFVFNEVNFRNGANTYSLIYDGVNIPFLWVQSLMGHEIKKLKKQVQKNFYFRNDMTEFTELRNKNISLKEYINAKSKSKINLFLNFSDIKPCIYKYIYAIIKRIKGKK